MSSSASAGVAGRAADVAVAAGVDLDALALGNEQRHLDGRPRLQLRGLRAACSRGSEGLGLGLNFGLGFRGLGSGFTLQPHGSCQQHNVCAYDAVSKASEAEQAPPEAKRLSRIDEMPADP